MENKKRPELSFADDLERKLQQDYRIALWSPFTRAIKEYRLIEPSDKVCVCISGGKDSMIMALLFKRLLKYGDFPFEAKFLVMDPGYNPINLQMIKKNLSLLEIPAVIVNTDIFEIANSQTESPCYLCAKMRRGALYRIAKSFGCNKIALGHHYDDVIETTLMNMLNAGSFQTMLPKLVSTNYEGMEVIRPLYRVREKDIIAFKNENHLSFIQCACRFTENCAVCDNGGGGSQRAKTKALIKNLKENYNEFVEKNIFSAASKVQLDKILGYEVGDEEHSFLDNYDKKKEAENKRISSLSIEEAAIKKAEDEHKPFVIDDSFEKEFGSSLVHKKR